MSQEWTKAGAAVTRLLFVMLKHLSVTYVLNVHKDNLTFFAEVNSVTPMLTSVI